ncbi:thioredoxin family protein [bacterium]|nr:thioredoxin family protein [bacterium]
MKKIKNTILAALLLVGMSGFTLYESLQIGAKAPMTTLKMKDTNGKMISLNDVKKENGLLVMFTCNTCPFVKAWEDRYTKIQKTAADKGIGVILVNSNEGKRENDDSIEAMKKHAAEKGFTAPYVVDADSKLANAFGAATTPHVYLFNKEFKLAYVGAIDDNYKSAGDADKHYLMDAINNMVAGKSINPSETKALGCSIKRP